MTGTRRSVALVAGAATAVFGVLVSMMPFVLELEEAFGLRWLFTARGPLKQPDEVAVVSLSGDSADAFGLTSDIDEWPRSLHGKLIERLAKAGAAVIVFDIIFDLQSRPEEDRRLADAISKAGNVILLERVRSERIELPAGQGGAIIERRVGPIESLRKAALTTAPFTLPVVPIRVSQFWTFGRGAGDTATLPAVALHAYASSAHDELLELLVSARPQLASRLASIDSNAIDDVGLAEVMRRIRGIFRLDPLLGGDLRALIQEGEGSAGKDHALLLRALVGLYAGRDSRYLNFYGPARTIRTVAYHDAVLGTDTEKLREAVEGRVVFVGFSETRQPEQQDAFISVFSQRSGQNLSGVEIGATAFANLLHGEAIRPLPLPAHWLAVACWGIVVGALCVALRSVSALAAAVVIGALYAAAAHYLFRSQDLWVPLAVPLGVQLPAALLAGLLLNYRLLRQQRERIQSALGYYVPARVVDRLAHETIRPRADRELVFGTCLVTDAEQYTTLSEALHPAELGELMDAYYEVLVKAVDRHGGVVSDIGGDSMVAVWPASQSVGTTHADACTAAMEMLQAVDAFNRSRVRRELPTRIGLDSGQLLLGSIGSSGRGEFRAVGDIVNTAARLQGLNRLLGTRILLSATTADETADLVLRPLGDFLLLGKRSPVSVLELQAAAGGAEPRLAELNEAFAAALKCFREGRWAEAESAFRAILERFPGDGPSRFLLEQCRALRVRYPDGPWDGVVTVSVK
ncbi:MAG TPA: CHASE2 domain-containing protein [Gammaproteobacteria bacterium]